MNADPCFRIVYVSRNLLPPRETAAALEQILEASRRRNARVGVTGALLFSDDCFAQALEGPIDAVEAVFEHIQCDERHNDVVIVEAGLVGGREFAEWSMAYAGHCTDEQARFERLVGPSGAGRPEAGSRVRDLLRGAVARAMPAVS